MQKLGAAGLALFMLSGCAGRAPQLTPLIQVSDTQLSCSEIEAETKLNSERISSLSGEQNWKLGQNAVAGVVGFMVWPAWLALDFQNAAGQEASSLANRNDYLSAMAKSKCQPAAQTAAATDIDGEQVPAFAPQPAVVSSDQFGLDYKRPPVLASQ